VLRYYGMPMRWEMLYVPLLLLVTFMFALAAGLWLATVSVKYRDVSFAIGFLLQALMYASPVIYPVSMVPPSVQFLYQLNPMSAVIQGFRWALLGSGSPPGLTFGLATVLAMAALISGAYVFRRTERTVVDIL
jgi:lipopolysaccharide transport system permease protein